MRKPAIIDGKVKKYVEYLEDKLSEFSSTSVEVDSYLALRNFVYQGNKLLSELSFDGTELKDKDDKAIERGLKFADKVLDYNQSLSELYEKVGEKKVEEAKGKQKSASVYESVMPPK